MSRPTDPKGDKLMAHGSSRSGWYLVLVLLGGLAGVLTAAVTVDAATTSDRPLDQYWGFARTDEDQALEEAIFEVEEDQRQALIVSCMSEHGFQYVPWSSSVVMEGVVDEPSILEVVANPNDSYVEMLEPPDKLRYYVALTGLEDPYSETAGAAQGCVGASHTAMPGVFYARGLLVEELFSMEASIADHLSLVELHGAWVDCMSNQGWEFEHPRDVNSMLDDAAAEGSSTVDAELDKPEAMDDLDTCAASVGLTKAVVALRLQMEEELIDRHRDLLVVADRENYSPDGYRG